MDQNRVAILPFSYIATASRSGALSENPNGLLFLSDKNAGTRRSWILEQVAQLLAGVHKIN
jgi:hypothetical protein